MLALSKDVIIDGSGLAVPITISGNSAVRVFYINSGVIVTLNRINVSNGMVSGGDYSGVIVNHSRLTVSNSTLSGNSAYDGGCQPIHPRYYRQPDIWQFQAAGNTLLRTTFSNWNNAASS
jgi:hypothetical protein